jgi:hypothetical protein
MRDAPPTRNTARSGASPAAHDGPGRLHGHPPEHGRDEVHRGDLDPAEQDATLVDGERSTVLRVSEV